jgi:hypothetical protein
MENKELTGWKQRYNKYLKRHYKAITFMDNCDIPKSDREKWIPDYREVLKELNYILSLFENDGIQYTTEEALEGFEI